MHCLEVHPSSDSYLGIFDSVTLGNFKDDNILNGDVKLLNFEH